MRKIVILCAAVLLVGAAALVWYLTRREHYGKPFAGAPKANIKDLVEKPEQHLDADFTVEGTIVRQCPATGCWLFLRDASGKDIRVEMSGIASTFPQRGGKRATVEGRLRKKGDSYEVDTKAVEFK
jgi:uncharacterized protein YdeI (BOF family)